MEVYICSSAIYPRDIINESESEPGKEYITVTGTLFNEAVCTCPGFFFRETCKHVQAIKNCNEWMKKEQWEAMCRYDGADYSTCFMCGSPMIEYETEPEDYNGEES